VDNIKIERQERIIWIGLMWLRIEITGGLL
jgi:hypothetical protein